MKAPDRLFVYGTLMGDGEIAATLPGHRLDFGAFATVVEELGATTYGVLVENVGPLDLRRYDAFESVHTGFYSRKIAAVVTDDGPTTAWVYEMNADDLADAKRRGYVRVGLAETMRRHYDRVGHPAAAHIELDRRIEEATDGRLPSVV